MTPARKRLVDYWSEHSTDDESPPLFGPPEGDPLDEAIIGLTELPPTSGEGWRQAWVYDGRKLRDILINAASVPEDEVDDHISYNVEGACKANGPVIVWPLCDCDEAHDR